MAISKASIQEELATADADDDLFQEEDSVYNFRQLLDQVSSSPENDIIFTIPSDQIETLKQGLIRRKSKDATKLRDAGLTPDNLALSFLVYASKDADGKDIPGQTDVRVKMRPRMGVTILDIRIPNDDL